MTAPRIIQETLPIGSVKGYAGNARKRSPRQRRVLMDSIREFGFASALVVDENSELIAGHGRWEAAKALGYEELPVIRVCGLSEVQKRALRLADNRLGELSSWNKELLKTELEAVIDCSFDTDLTGFSRIEVDAMLTIDGVDEDEEEPVPEPKAFVVSRLGDLWKLGQHRVFCGDSRQAASYAAVLCGGVAQQVITDIPYNLQIAGTVSGLGRIKHDEFEMASGEMTPEEFTAFITTVMTLARDASVDGSIHYWFCDWRIVADMITVGRRTYHELKNVAVWVKPNSGMGAFLRSQHELVVILKNGTKPHSNNVQLGKFGRNRSNVWIAEGANSFGRLRQDTLKDHPTPKSVRLIADAIRDTSQPNDMVLDPFGGSGSTLIAAHDIGRRAALIELSPKYVDVILRRYLQHAGEEPVLLPGGEPFSAVQLHRWNKGE